MREPDTARPGAPSSKCYAKKNEPRISGGRQADLRDDLEVCEIRKPGSRRDEFPVHPATEVSHWTRII